MRPDPSDLRRLAPLLDRAWAVDAHVFVEPPDIALALALEAVAHHVTRKALTDAMKHAPGAALNSRLVLDGRALTISIPNDTAAAASPIADTGLGLTGMRERIAALRATLDAGQDSDGGFRLTATLPLNETRREMLHPDSIIEPVTAAAVRRSSERRHTAVKARA